MGFLRDYYVDLNFRGMKTVIVPHPTTRRMLVDFWPSSVNYPFKAAMQEFNYKDVDALNVRWMRYPAGSDIHCTVVAVEALQEIPNSVDDIQLAGQAATLGIPSSLQSGDYAEYWGTGVINVFDKNNSLLFSTAPSGQDPVLESGMNSLSLTAPTSGSIGQTSITVSGEP